MGTCRWIADGAEVSAAVTVAGLSADRECSDFKEMGAAMEAVREAGDEAVYVAHHDDVPYLPVSPRDASSLLTPMSPFLGTTLLFVVRYSSRR